MQSRPERKSRQAEQVAEPARVSVYLMLRSSLVPSRPRHTAFLGITWFVIKKEGVSRQG